MQKVIRVSNYLDHRRRLKLGLEKPAGPKPKKPIPKQSEKKKQEVAKEKKERGSEPTDKEKWFRARRKELTGTCQCGCGRKSSKFDDLNFRSSCCHIFPQALFPSVALHPLNCVERNFWDGCHTNMDNKSMDLWPQMADWEDIKERFHVLSPLLTDKERAKKFYSTLEKLVYAN